MNLLPISEKEEAKAGPMGAGIRFTMDDKVYHKIMHWVNKAPGEVSGLGMVVIENGHYRVVDAVLLKQENTAASTDIDGAAIAKAMYELRNASGSLNFWWHSHVNMGVFWSGTDTDTIREIGKNGWLLSTVFNKRAERKTALYFPPHALSGGFVPETFLDNLNLEIISYLDQADIARWDQEFEEKCKAKTWESDWSAAGGYKRWNPETREFEVVPWQDIDKPAGNHGQRTLWEEYQAGHEAIDAENLAEIAEGASASTHILYDHLEDMAGQMEEEDDEKRAKRLLTRICRVLKGTKLISPEECRNLKLEYIERYNISRPKEARVNQ